VGERQLLPWLLFLAVPILWGISIRFDLPISTFGQRAGENLWKFLLEMAAFLLLMFVLIGLFDVWIPREVVERHVGRETGLMAIPWMVMLATFQAGPLYAAFPVAMILWKKGCAPRNVFIYLGAISAMKLLMLTFEVACLGWRFSLARTAATLPVFIGLAYVLERLLPRDYHLPDCSDH